MICDDCWNATPSYWTFGDKRRRCRDCFELFVSVLLNKATPQQLENYHSLIGVLNA